MCLNLYSSHQTTQRVVPLWKYKQLIKMHKYVLYAAALIAVVLAAPQQQEQQTVQIIKQESDVNPEGYRFEYETSDGTSRQEQGTLKQVSEDHKAIEVSGSYKYIAPDGLQYTVTFTANEHGFQPQERVDHPGQDQGQTQGQGQDQQQYSQYQQFQ